MESWTKINKSNLKSAVLIWINTIEVAYKTWMNQEKLKIVWNWQANPKKTMAAGEKKTLF